ncbi:hypothetical protein E2C01_074436 [Portunus trituberculatus]|uniref:Uncharacterized protein n=1 Tax=Portunus trituberculatus TaxID=210409 RepID=A0A5B7IC49_PORTR|nr:hypothetical protein [Portunus trituberculatus]
MSASRYSRGQNWRGPTARLHSLPVAASPSCARRRFPPRPATPLLAACVLAAGVCGCVWAVVVAVVVVVVVMVRGIHVIVTRPNENKDVKKTYVATLRA